MSSHSRFSKWPDETKAVILQVLVKSYKASKNVVIFLEEESGSFCQ